MTEKTKDYKSGLDAKAAYEGCEVVVCEEQKGNECGKAGIRATMNAEMSQETRKSHLAHIAAAIAIENIRTQRAYNALGLKPPYR